MYVSGTLKDKTVNFYKENMTYYDHTGLNTNDVFITYNGSLSFSPWKLKTEEALIRKQNLYISNGLEKIHRLIKERNFVLNKEFILKTIKNIQNFRNIQFILYEYLYKIIYNSKTNYDLSIELKRFNSLLEYLNSLEFLNQIDLEIILKLFINNLQYSKNDVCKEKIKTYKIDERQITYIDIYNLVLLGEFIAPKRLPIVANTLQNDYEFSKYILPIYFGLKDDLQAKRFLESTKKHNMDLEQIEKNAINYNVPSNLVSINRR